MKNDFSFRSNHFDAFQSMARPGVWMDRDAASWVESVGVDGLGKMASSRPLSRSILKRLSAAGDASDRDVLWSILAWGGMRRDAARRLAQHEDLWAHVVGRLRRDGLDRRASYHLCQDAIKEVGSCGIGPAYFTKLIFFANPAHDGYIMDQWTSRSINLLIDGPPVVKMRAKNHVDPRNNEDVFENFCCAVEALTSALHKVSPEETELCLFSKGGRNPHPWRRYLLQNGG